MSAQHPTAAEKRTSPDFACGPSTDSGAEKRRLDGALNVGRIGRSQRLDDG
jgi:hypothetical protein